MSKYRVRDITIWKEDSNKAETILEKYRRNNYFDDMRIESRKHTVVYWLNPYLYEDLDIIIGEIKEAGIQIL